MKQFTKKLAIMGTIILTGAILPAFAASNQWVVSWDDNADNEEGFIVERKTDGEYLRLTTVGANTTSYTEIDAMGGETYCYRVAAYNQAGNAYSDESCFDAPESEPEPEPNDPGYIDFWYTFTDKPGVIELDGKEFYGFKSGTSYNADYSLDEVLDVDFSIDFRSLTYPNSNAFVVKENGVELQTGFAKFKFNERNNVSFLLQGSGNYQTATVYLSAKAEVNDAEFVVSVGDITETITLPDAGTSYYLTIDVAFDQSANVKITPIGNYKRRSYMKIAGVVLNEASESTTIY